MTSECKQEERPPKKMKTVTKNGEEELDWDFPKSIQEFGYTFKDDGKLKHMTTGESFEFNVSNNNLYNQKRYEALGELINEYVFELLQTEGQLSKTYIPHDAKKNEPRSFIFTSSDAMTNTDKLLVLIHGSGVVRAGQWARRLIINDCLDSGTQLPFIKRGLSEGYGIIVLNTNYNSVDDNPIRGSSKPEEHVAYIWKHFIYPSKARHIAIVAHSYGGVCVIDLLENYLAQIKERVFAIAMTDSVHNLEIQGIPHSPEMKWLRQIARNWVSSPKRLDETVVSYGRIDIYKVSAGTTLHEMTSYSSFESIFKFLAEKYKEASKSVAGGGGATAAAGEL